MACELSACILRASGCVLGAGVVRAQRDHFLRANACKPTHARVALARCTAELQTALLLGRAQTRGLVGVSSSPAGRGHSFATHSTRHTWRIVIECTVCRALHKKDKRTTAAMYLEVCATWNVHAKYAPGGVYMPSMLPVDGVYMPKGYALACHSICNSLRNSGVVVKTFRILHVSGCF